jgi:hypothetical protein
MWSGNHYTATFSFDCGVYLYVISLGRVVFVVLFMLLPLKENSKFISVT